MKFALLMTAALAAGLSGGANAQAPAWQAAGKWQIEYADKQCVASRPFKSADSQILLAIRPSETNDSAEMAILAPGSLRLLDLAKIEVFVGDEKAKAADMYRMPAVAEGQVLHTFYLDEDEFTKLIQVQRLKLVSESLAFDVPLERIDDVRRLLNDCINDLLETWGLDPAVRANLASFPKPGSRPIFDGSDYPHTALRRGALGRTKVRVIVGVDGRARDCQVILTSGHKDLDETTCRITTSRARFEPAKTKDGRSVESPYLYSIRWMTSSR